MGYLTVSLIFRLWGRRITGGQVVLVALGSQFHDLVDKPLAWYAGVLPAGRSLAHSALTIGALSITAILVAHRSRRYSVTSAGVFLLGVWTHLFGDALLPLVQGDHSRLSFLLWPVVELPDYEGEIAIETVLATLSASPELYLTELTAEAVFVGAAVLAWIADGTPGLWFIGRSERDPSSIEGQGG